MESIYCWVIVHSNTDSENSVGIACKNEILAEKFIKKLEEFSDSKVFEMDFYGYTTLKEIKEIYKNTNLYIHSNNICIKTIYDLIYK